MGVYAARQPLPPRLRRRDPGPLDRVRRRLCRHFVDQPSLPLARPRNHEGRALHCLDTQGYGSGETMTIFKDTLDTKAIDALRARLRGALLQPGEAGYDE